MNRLNYWQDLFSEFGWKTRWLDCDEGAVESTIARLRLKHKYNVNNLVISLAQQGIIEVLDILDSVALQLYTH